jgi:hypothetical protein
MINNSTPVKLAKIDRHSLGLSRCTAGPGSGRSPPESSLATLNQATPRVEAERYRRAKGVLSVAVEACGCCLIGPEYFGRGESI